jgi:UDP-N-acetylglucosamine acyltransferase
MAKIHPTAIVESGAELDSSVVVGAYSIVGAQVKLAAGVVVGSHVVINGQTTIGARTEIKPFSSIGAQPQDLKYRGEPAELVIGADNSIREYVNMSIGTQGGGGVTRVGDRNLFMVHVHVAHDCNVANDCIFANGVSLAGHVDVGDKAVLGGHSAVHQFCRVGNLAMIAGGAMVTQDVPPFVTVHGDRAGPKGLNLIGLKRSGATSAEMEIIRDCYRLLYSESLTVDTAVEKMQKELGPSPLKDAFIEFVRTSERGVCR